MYVLKNVSSFLVNLGNFQCWGVLLGWLIVGQGSTARAVSADGNGWIYFFRLSYLFPFVLSRGCDGAG